MMVPTPNRYYLVAGKGDAPYELNAFDNALLDAKVGNTNLVRMSSILPPAAVETKPVQLPLGALIPIAYASITGNIRGEMIAAAVAVAIPEDPSLNGLIMEHSSPGTAEEVEQIVREKARLGMEHRGYAIKEIKSVSIEHQVEDRGAAFAAAVLWYEED